MQPDQLKRIKRFSKWWSNNKTNRKASKWLVKHTQRCVHDYAMDPDVWDKAKQIIKRYNLSEYRRLTRSDAWFLWRVTHPLHNDRVQRILATAAFLAEKKEQVQQPKTKQFDREQVDELMREAMHDWTKAMLNMYEHYEKNDPDWDKHTANSKFYHCAGDTLNNHSWIIDGVFRKIMAEKL